jgi:hypothetical protein
MSGFTAESLPAALDFDFTGIPQQDGSGPCTGKGTMPEPSEKSLQSFFDSVNALRSLETAPAEEIEARAAGLLDEVRENIVAVGNGTPTLEELRQLPPRAFRAFYRWLLQEFTDPKE